MLIKNNEKIKGLKVFDNIFFCTSFADETVFWCEYEVDVSILSFSGLIPHLEFGLTSMKSLRGIKKVIYGIKWIDLTRQTVKI